MIKAIETRYAGCRFRSRLEARWAVFFDHLGIEWQYEPQGFHIETGYAPPDYKSWQYLPDFYLPTFGTWVEVKGDFSTFDWNMIAWTIDWDESLPGVEDSLGTTRGLLILGPIPDVKLGFVPAHPILQHRKGGSVQLASFGGDGLKLMGDTGEGFDYFDSTWHEATAEDPWVKTIKKFFPGGLGYSRIDSKVAGAYQAARRARFEHGERG